MNTPPPLPQHEKDRIKWATMKNMTATWLLTQWQLIPAAQVLEFIEIYIFLFAICVFFPDTNANKTISGLIYPGAEIRHNLITPFPPHHTRPYLSHMAYVSACVCLHVKVLPFIPFTPEVCGFGTWRCGGPSKQNRLPSHLAVECKTKALIGEEITQEIQSHVVTPMLPLQKLTHNIFI